MNWMELVLVLSVLILTHFIAYCYGRWVEAKYELKIAEQQLEEIKRMRKESGL